MKNAGEGSATVCSVISQGILDVVEERRAALTLSRSAYVGLILKRWKTDGFPPVSAADAAMQELKRPPA